MTGLGERIRDARKAAGFTQEKLAERIGVSRTTIAKWERDEKEPVLLNLVCIAQVLCVSTDHLLGLRGSDTLSAEAVLALERFIREVRK